MKKIIIVLETLERSRRSKFLRIIERILGIFELNIWIVPFIKKLSKRFHILVISDDYEILEFLKQFDVTTIKLSGIKLDDDIRNMIKKSVELSKSWYQYKDVDRKIVFLADIGVILQQEFAELFFDRIKKLKIIRKIIDDMKPVSIYVDNASSSIGQIVCSVAESEGIKVFQMLPRPYGKIKNRIRTHLLYRRTQIPSIYHGTSHLLSFPIRCGEGMFKILVDAPYINFMDAIFPVINVLSRKGYKIYVLGKKEDIVRYSHDFIEIPVRVKNTGAKEAIQMKKYLSQILNDEKFHEIFKYENINFWKSIEIDMQYLFNKRIPRMILSLIEHEIVFKNVEPDIILVGDDRTEYVRTGVMLAKNKGIPVVEIQHGIYVHTYPMVPPISDKICVWGIYAKNVLRKAGAAENQIVITGCPKFDFLFEKKKIKFLREKRHKKILFATQYGFEDVTAVVLEEIIKFLSTNEDVYLIIKPHPEEKSDLYRRFEQYEKVTVEDSGANINDLLLDADVLITISSTVGINAAILGVPIILLNFDGISSPYTPISLEVREIKGVIPAIKNVLYNREILQKISDAREKFIYEHGYRIDGKASERVADLIENLLRERRGER